MMKTRLFFTLLLVAGLAWACTETPPEPEPVDQLELVVSCDIVGSHSARFRCDIGNTERVFTGGGFYYSPSPDLSGAKKAPGIVLNQVLSATVSDLQPETVYYLKAYLTDRYETYESETIHFDAASFTVSQRDFQVPYTGGAINLTVMTAEDFRIDIKDADWISLVSTKVNSLHTQTIQVASNSSLLSRAATLTLISPDGYFKESVRVSQDGAPVSIVDAALKAYLVSRYDTNKSGEIEFDEIPSVTTIDIQSGEIGSLAGIEFFPELRTLICRGSAGKEGRLASLDLSQNPNLEQIDVSHNQLDSIDVSHCPLLKTLDCSFNQIVALDLSDNEPLELLDCRSNRLESLYLDNNIRLQKVNCDDNVLTSLRSIMSEALTELSCNYNELEKLDLLNNKKLVSLSCAHNQLTVLKNTSPFLTTLDCSSNFLEDLTIRKYDNLQTLDCSDNQIKTLDIRHNARLERLDCSINQIRQLDVLSAKALRYLDCHDNPLSMLDVIGLDKLKDLYCNCPSMTTLYVEERQGIEGICVNRSEKHVNPQTVVRSHAGLAVIEDPVFKQHLLQYHDSDQDGELSLDEAVTIASLNICTDQIRTLKGIEYLTGLKYLKCEGSLDAQGVPQGRLTSLDLSANGQLEQLLCGRNQLESIDVSGNSNLKTLWCFQNKLTKLDVSHNPLLCDLNCERNLITTLDLIENPDLTSLDCSPMQNESGANLLYAVSLDRQIIDYINGKKYRRSVSNIPSGTELYRYGKKTGYLPEKYMFNFNAVSFDVASRSFSRMPDALWQHDMTLNNDGFSVDDRFVHIRRGTYSQWNFGSSSANPFNLTGQNATLTIIVKVKGEKSEDFSIFANRSDMSGYNYMLREGEGESPYYFYLHDSRSFDEERGVLVQTLPNIVAVRVQEGKVWLESYTDRISSPVVNTSWGSPSDAISFFYGGYGGEYWEGDFYWIFLSLEPLTDDEIDAVIQYNESL